MIRGRIMPVKLFLRVIHPLPCKVDESYKDSPKCLSLLTYSNVRFPRGRLRLDCPESAAVEQQGADVQPIFFSLNIGAARQACGLTRASLLFVLCGTRRGSPPFFGQIMF